LPAQKPKMPIQCTPLNWAVAINIKEFITYKQHIQTTSLM